MSKLSRQFKVPDELANLYDFANTTSGASRIMACSTRKVMN